MFRRQIGVLTNVAKYSKQHVDTLLFVATESIVGCKNLSNLIERSRDRIVVAVNGSQRGVDLVRKASHQNSEGRHLLRLHQLSFRVRLCRKVNHEEVDGGPVRGR